MSAGLFNGEKMDNVNKILSAKKMAIEENRVAQNAQTASYLKMPLHMWRPILAKECGVFVVGEMYLGKRFDQINYSYCTLETAKEIVEDNCYALLRYKYFTKPDDEVDKRIADIIKSFKANLKTTLLRKSFNVNDADECGILKNLPMYCVAFKNGVFNFKDNKFLFKYDILKVDGITNRIYQYDPDYAIMWYLNYNFVPMDGIDIMELPLEDFVDVLKENEELHRKDDPESKSKNLCFELMWNMSHDMFDMYNPYKFKHLCEILGYLMDPQFVQKFVMLIGAGRNGKNSLFDGCFTNKVVPMPTQNSLVAIEEDKFITGTLEGKFHNIFLETDERSASTTSSAMLKQLTGSQLQTIESKGKDKHSGYINCKFIFSANEQEKVKFGDVSIGFRRRINMFEVYYQYDQDLKFMKKNPDYYNTTYSQDLHEISDNLLNTITFVYLAMYGIKSATKDFKKSFEFSRDDYNMTYSDINTDIKEKVRDITADKLAKWVKESKKTRIKNAFLDGTGKEFWQNSKELKDFGLVGGFDSVYKALKDDETRNDYFADHEIYIGLEHLKDLIEEPAMSATKFTSTFKKLFANAMMIKTADGKQYVKVTFIGVNLKVA